MELLDVYDENKQYIGQLDRKVVHSLGMWHKVGHCWIFDNTYIYFQLRQDRDGLRDNNKLYVTTSGHVQLGESVTDGVKREMKEELGLDLESENDLSLIKDYTFSVDIPKDNGEIFKDRAFVKMYCHKVPNNVEFTIDPNEIEAIVKLKISDLIDLADDKIDNVEGYKKENFLFFPHETFEEKYGEIFRAINKINAMNK